ncbi:hypothetical protein BAUCODRAFT_29229, partial [Baudoinia panamericana UAMH 10762]
MSFKKRSRTAFEADAASNAGPPPHAPYALYGTPLPAPRDADARDDGTYLPIWKQEVTDERGRKRLHGAFTGGWSAGYFNTVGSKEGWTPATFVSSRSKRVHDGDGGRGQTPTPTQTRVKGQRVEDFMDEEDLAERAEGQRLELEGSFAGLGRAAAGGGDGGERGGMFSDLFRTSGDETMGVKLLQRMGWRPGQGVGPKVRRKAKGDEKGEVHLFAPEDSRMVSFERKTDRKGLGYAGEGRLEGHGGVASQAHEDDGDERDARILEMNRSKLLKKPAKTKKTGFGVGVLNDTGSDDEDPYAIGPQISYNRVIGGDKGKNKKKGGLIAGSTNPATPVKPTFTSKKLTQQVATLPGFRKCHDGRLPLDGFVLSLAPLTLSDSHPPPEVPSTWTSSKLQPDSKSADTSANPYKSTTAVAKTSTLTPTSRATLLGEQPLPGKSVFDFLSPATRDRLATASGNSNLPPARSEGAPAGYTPNSEDQRRTLWDLIPPLEKSTAEAALNRWSDAGWMPYAEDEGKRARYRAFLSLRAGLHASLPERGKGMSVEDWARELREFAQAAAVFRPISGLMAARFTTSTGTARLASDAAEAGSGNGQREGEGSRGEDPAEEAARVGMYGPLTRVRLPFYPTRLLCKRFGVKPPVDTRVDGDGSDGGGGIGKSRLDVVVSQASLNRMMEAKWSTPGFVSGGVEGTEMGGERDGREAVGVQQSVEIDAEKNEALEGQRAGEAVFKAIFGSDDED